MQAPCQFCKVIFKKKQASRKFCSVVCANRANLNNKKLVTTPTTYSKELAELFGILLGDGSVTTYFAKVYLNFRLETEYSIFVTDLCKKLFPGSTVTRTGRVNRGTWEIQISSKTATDYLRKIGFDPKSRTIPAWIDKNATFKRAVLRGLFDTEGSVGIKYYRGKAKNTFYKQLTVTNKNKNILTFIEKTLLENNFKPTKSSSANIYISNTLDIKRYMRDIGSHNPKLLSKLETETLRGFDHIRRSGREV